MAMADLFQSDVAPDFALHGDLSREVYCILGVPVDAIGMNAVLRRIGSASTAGTPFLISTPNPNSLVISQLDREFREALILSDLCTADGMPIIWIAWLIGIPIKKREIMMFIDEIERLRAVSRPPMTTCVSSAKRQDSVMRFCVRTPSRRCGMGSRKIPK
jgi:hypothetical protein